jgi:hypothetical protein
VIRVALAGSLEDQMISVEVEAAVSRLLHERGLKQLPGEKLGDFVARGLDITPKQAHDFLAALNDGKTIEDARLIAGIESSSRQAGLLEEIGRTIGAALGKVATTLSID